MISANDVSGLVNALRQVLDGQPFSEVAIAAACEAASWAPMVAAVVHEPVVLLKDEAY